MELLNTETGRIIAMIVVVLLAFLLSSLVKKLMYFLYAKISGKRDVEPGKFFLLTILLRIIIIVVGVSYAISLEPTIESSSKSLLASAGIATNRTRPDHGLWLFRSGRAAICGDNPGRR